MKNNLLLILLLFSFGLQGQGNLNLVKDINIGEENGAINSVRTHNGIGFFIGSDGIHGNELWRTDGTEEGTYMVKDIREGAESGLSISYNLRNVFVDDFFYFSANDGSSGIEIWKSDGTEEGTNLVADINVGTSNSNPRILSSLNGEILFAASDGMSGDELWKTDGTAAGTSLVLDLISGSEGSFPINAVSLNDEIYFFAEGESFDQRKVWKSDGTTEGTVVLKEVVRNGGFLSQQGGKLYFTGSEGFNTAPLAWVSDGTPEGTFTIMPADDNQFASPPRHYTAYNGQVYFQAYNNIWRTDGTAAGTEEFRETELGTTQFNPNPFFAFNEELYVGTEDNFTVGNELYITDGSSFSLLEDIYNGQFDSDPGNFYIFGGKLFFTADDNELGRELWSTDGTSENTQMEFDLNTGTGDSNPSGLFTLNGELYMIASTEDTGAELYKYSSSIDCSTLSEDGTTLENASTGTLGSFSIDISGGTPPYSYQLNDEEMTANNVFTNLSVGEYTLTVTDNNGCELVVDFTIEMETGLSDVNLSDKLDISPNPFNNTIKIDLIDLHNEELTVEIYTSTGQLLIQQKGQFPMTIDNMETFAKGLYLMNIKSSESQSLLATGKLVKK